MGCVFRDRQIAIPRVLRSSQGSEITDLTKAASAAADLTTMQSGLEKKLRSNIEETLVNTLNGNYYTDVLFEQQWKKAHTCLQTIYTEECKPNQPNTKYKLWKGRVGPGGFFVVNTEKVIGRMKDECPVLFDFLKRQALSERQENQLNKAKQCRENNKQLKLKQRVTSDGCRKTTRRWLNKAKEINFAKQDTLAMEGCCVHEPNKKAVLAQLKRYAKNKGTDPDLITEDSLVDYQSSEEYIVISGVFLD